MKNNTKVRLHLSKQLFESLTKQVLAEGKMKKEALGGYTEVKMPKENKAAEKMTNKMQKMEEVGAPPIPPLPSVDKANLKNVNTDIKDVATFAKALVDIAKKLKGGEGFNPETDPNIKRAMDALRAAAGAPGIPAIPEKKPTKGAPGIPPLKGSRMGENQVNEISSEGIAALVGLIPGVTLTAAIIKDIVGYMKDNNLKGIDGFKQAYKVVGGAASAHMDKKVGGNAPGQGHGVDTSKTFGPQNENQLSEFTGTETETSGAITMIATALGIGVPLAAALIKDLMRAKTPEEKKKVIQKDLAGKGGEALKEYEQHYEMVNGQCRRYNDEGEYEVVSLHYCR